MMLFIHPSFSVASFTHQYFLPLLVFCCFPPLCFLLQPWSVPMAHVLTLRRKWGLIWLFLWSHEMVTGPQGKTAKWTPVGGEPVITTACVLIHRGALEKAVSSSIHILSNSSQILLVVLILHQWIPMGTMSMDMNTHAYPLASEEVDGVF